MVDSYHFAKEDSLQVLLSYMFQSFTRLSELLRNGTGGKEIQQQNSFGDVQLDTDLECDAIIFEELKRSGVVAYALSEEKPQPIEINGPDKEYIVTFDPLDGSSIIGVNFSVGSIFGIWRNDANKLLGHKIGEQITAGAVVYGSRTSLIFFNTGTQSVDELTLKHNHWQLSKSNLTIKPKGNIFAPGNLRATQDLAPYKSCVQYWVDSGYTLRYTGGMVPDVYQLFIKGQGIFSNLGSKKHLAKLRVLYEIGPLAFLTVKAGGRASDGTSNLLDTAVESYDQRGGVVLGSAEEVERVETYLREAV